MPLIFISYAPADHELGEALAERLRRDGIDTVSSWRKQDLDQQSAESDWKVQVDSALSRCDAGIVVMSPPSVKSMVVAREYRYFLAANKPLFLVDSKPIPRALYPPHLIRLPRFVVEDDLTGVDALVSALKETVTPQMTVRQQSAQGFLPGAKVTVKVSQRISDDTEDQVVSLVEKLARVGFENIEVVSAEDDQAE